MSYVRYYSYTTGKKTVHGRIIRVYHPANKYISRKVPIIIENLTGVFGTMS